MRFLLNKYVFILLLLAAGGYYYLSQKQNPPAPESPPPITANTAPTTISAPEKTSAAPTNISGSGIGALGRIEPRNRVIRLSHDAGPEGARIAQLLVEEGQTIEAGTPVAIFSDQLRKQAATQIAQTEIERLKAKLNAYKAEERFAAREYERYRQLVKTNAVSQSKKDEADRDLGLSRANAAATLAELASAEARLTLAQEEEKQSQLLAPNPGTILRIHAWPGQRVGDEGVLEMADLRQLDVVAEIYERDMLNIREGQEAEITIPGLKDPLTGTVRQLGFQVYKNDINNTDPLANRDNRVIETRISLPESSSEQLRHLLYMQVQVRIVP